ncbi:hypothetical protein K469DRAFT_687151 [Zopfia rhizophila CBS 207.26]|uniref:Uncharacterized protein n=1 Tax=Zopfia rhizophila CBS 207.26 TaxID=1314779 RepID=A0A6A6E2W7_9PEZI|nr:hypothetical protein K469DRAFT_687151 [Zopfia rhizophila CBS 207.26]
MEAVALRVSNQGVTRALKKVRVLFDAKKGVIPNVAILNLFQIQKYEVHSFDYGSYDSKSTPSASAKRPEEVGVTGFGYGYETAICGDDFETKNLVGGHAVEGVGRDVAAASDVSTCVSDSLRVSAQVTLYTISRFANPTYPT